MVSVIKNNLWMKPQKFKGFFSHLLKTPLILCINTISLSLVCIGASKNIYLCKIFDNVIILGMIGINIIVNRALLFYESLGSLQWRRLRVAHFRSNVIRSCALGFIYKICLMLSYLSTRIGSFIGIKYAYKMNLGVFHSLSLLSLITCFYIVEVALPKTNQIFKNLIIQFCDIFVSFLYFSPFVKFTSRYFIQGLSIRLISCIFMGVLIEVLSHEYVMIYRRNVIK